MMDDNCYVCASYHVLFVEKKILMFACYMKRGGLDPVRLDGVEYYVLIKDGAHVPISDDIL